MAKVQGPGAGIDGKGGEPGSPLGGGVRTTSCPPPPNLFSTFLSITGQGARSTRAGRSGGCPAQGVPLMGIAVRWPEARVPFELWGRRQELPVNHSEEWFGGESKMEGKFNLRHADSIHHQSLF